MPEPYDPNDPDLDDFELDKELDELEIDDLFDRDLNEIDPLDFDDED